MEIAKTYERTRSKKMDTDSYFNAVYDETYTEILKLIVIRTSNADQVDDIFQNVYKSFYSRIIKKGYSDIKFPRAFLKKLAEKELSRHYKSKAIKREMETDLEGFDELVEPDAIPFVELMEQQETLEIIQNIVKRIPLLSYKSFMLFYCYDVSISTIANNLGISEENVKMRLYRARNAVRKGIEGESL